ncbi:cache domain-containing protein [Actinomadura alba]|uniref:Cache domain-containing protein n=1 Tax=Actinomadura alba TaxID=406431 RepID=A0ABR7M3C8_9ACTN|nr:cache domain-containing protein [Actinomadura alba]MBC6471088.1 hypothetical protein [Actinomadura alba]
MIGEVIERIFESVTEVRDLMVECHEAARAEGAELTDTTLGLLAPDILELLQREGELAVGMGLIVEPGLLPGHPLRLEWWQLEAAREEPQRLEVDLHPESLGFYDYAAAKWFAVPRQTRERHIVGPYVDVHGTDRYLLTLTVPVEVDGQFLGVAGADVPITRFETLVLHHLGDSTGEIVVVNSEDRVVFSTSAEWITGSLLSGPAARAAARAHALPRLPWLLLSS